MPIKICSEISFKGDKKRFAGAIDNLAKRQFYGPIKSAVVSKRINPRYSQFD